MTEIVFVKTREFYKTYEDFWRLVGLSGFATCYVDEINTQDDSKVYILGLRNGEWGEGWPDARAKLIHWNLEWGKYDALHGIMETWTSDRYHAEKIGARFVPVGSHPQLVNVQPGARWQSPEWDVALLAYMGPYRRAETQGLMVKAGFSLAPNAWDDERLRVLERSKVMVNVHQWDEWPCVPVQRFALAAAAGIPLISERMIDPFPFRPGVDFISVDRKYIPATVNQVLSNGQGRDLVANMMQRACGEFRFDKNVRAAVEQGE